MTGRPPLLGVVGTGRLGGAIVRRCAEEGLPARAYDSRRPDGWDTDPAPAVLVDCSAPGAVPDVLALSARLGVPLVECVSDLSDDHLAGLDRLSRTVPVVRADNLTLGNHLLVRAVEEVARVLRVLADAGMKGVLPEAAVLERHPVTKAHRPSATAGALALTWANAAGNGVTDVASLRGGRPVSDHEIRLTWDDQELILRHELRSLTAAAAGAIGVATWLTGRPPGRYHVRAVFDDMLRRHGAAALHQGVTP